MKSQRITEISKKLQQNNSETVENQNDKDIPKFSETGTVAPSNNRKKYIIIKNSASFTDCMSEINSMQIDNAKNIDIVK